MKTFALLFAMLMTSFAFATVIQNATYDAASETLQLDVVYSGGLKSHSFELAWDSCQTIQGIQQTSARLLDSGWDDTGAETLTQTLEFNLSTVSCRPAQLTVRFGRFSHATLWIE